jgi:DNA-binding phage protein
MKITILEGAGLSTTAAKSFDTEAAALAHVIARARALVSTAQTARFEKAVLERIVSEDGEKAVSEVVAGTIPFAKALAAAFAPQITIVTRAWGKDDEDEDR